MFRFLALGAAVVALSGCASQTRQVDRLLSAPRTEPRSRTIEKVPFINQSAGHCGPATLAMVMQSYGHSVSVDDLASQVYTPGLNGTFQTDMISASRRKGMMAIPIEGFTALLAEVSAGHPVIVFENLALSWLPQWHYAVVYGFDLDHETVQMHSGPEAAKVWDIRKLERSWELADYWGLVVLPPDKLSASADELSHAKAAAGLDQANHLNEAQIAYRAMLTRWPESLTALIGVSNKAFEAGNYAQAVTYLTTATVHHPRVAAAWHNRALAEMAAGMKKPARASANRALDLVASELRSQYESSLAEILK
ncbi:hypothetical protein BH10BDE1_BH10BDE1_16320 [soil metagenome]